MLIISNVLYLNEILWYGLETLYNRSDHDFLYYNLKASKKSFMGGYKVAEKFNLQDRFLNHLRVNKIEVKVYLVNGFQTKGFIRSFDSYTVLLESGNQQSLIYKHAISTIIPSSYVKLMKSKEEGEEKEEEKNKNDREE